MGEHAVPQHDMIGQIQTLHTVQSRPPRLHTGAQATFHRPKKGAQSTVDRPKSAMKTGVRADAVSTCLDDPRSRMRALESLMARPMEPARHRIRCRAILHYVLVDNDRPDVE